MRLASLTLAGLAVAGALATSALVTAPLVYAQQAGTPWLRVEVVDGDNDRVGINVPLALAELALRIAPLDEIRNGRMAFEGHDMKLADIRALWEELKKAGDGEFVNIQSDDETVLLSREGDMLRVRVDKGDDDELVMVDAPVDVVDALLSGDGEELNLLEAVRRLGERGGDVVRVRDGDERVRVWIDIRPSA